MNLADARTNMNVARAMVRLGRWLKSKGAKTVRYLIVPSVVNGITTKGVDDYFAAGGTIERLNGVAVETEPYTESTDDTFSDSRLAEVLADEVLADRFIWCAALGWLGWNGQRWAEASQESVGEAVRQFAIARFIDVQRNLVSGKLTTPKNTNRRRVDMSAHLTETLEKRLVAAKVAMLKAGEQELKPWVFANGAGETMDGDNFRRRVFQPALTKAKLRQVRIHDLRHTYASLLIQQGESLAYVRDQLGHSSIQVTVDVYGHLVPGSNRAAVDRLDDAQIRKPGASSADGAETGTDAKLLI